MPQHALTLDNPPGGLCWQIIITGKIEPEGAAARCIQFRIVNLLYSMEYIQTTNKR